MKNIWLTIDTLSYDVRYQWLSMVINGYVILMFIIAFIRNDWISWYQQIFLTYFLVRLWSQVSEITEVCDFNSFFWARFAASSSSSVYVFKVLVSFGKLSKVGFWCRVCVPVWCLRSGEGSLTFPFEDELHFLHSVAPCRSSLQIWHLKYFNILHKSHFYDIILMCSE